MTEYSSTLEGVSYRSRRGVARDTEGVWLER